MSALISLALFSLTLAPATEPTLEQKLFCGHVYQTFAPIQKDVSDRETYGIMAMGMFMEGYDKPDFSATNDRAKAAVEKARFKNGKDVLPELVKQCDKMVAEM